MIVKGFNSTAARCAHHLLSLCLDGSSEIRMTGDSDAFGMAPVGTNQHWKAWPLAQL